MGATPFRWFNTPKCQKQSSLDVMWLQAGTIGIFRVIPRAFSS